MSASATQVTYNFEVTNNQLVTPFYYTNTLTPLGKIEREVNDLVVGDGYIDIGVSKIGYLSTIIIKAENADVRFTKTNSGVIDIGVNGIMVWEVSDNLSSGIVGCKVSTSSSSPVDVTITLIGVA
jgi:hypothetical protein